MPGLDICDPSQCLGAVHACAQRAYPGCACTAAVLHNLAFSRRIIHRRTVGLLHAPVLQVVNGHNRVGELAALIRGEAWYAAPPAGCGACGRAGELRCKVTMVFGNARTPRVFPSRTSVDEVVCHCPVSDTLRCKSWPSTGTSVSRTSALMS